MVKFIQISDVKTQLKKNYSLLPLVVMICGASVLIFGSSFRHLTKNPDVIIDRVHNPKPWEKMIEGK